MEHRQTVPFVVRARSIFLLAALLASGTYLFAQGPPNPPPGRPEGAGPPAKLRWFLDGEPLKKINNESFDGASGVTVTFVSSRTLKDVVVWPTPSLSEKVQVSPDGFATVEPDTPTAITITLLGQPAAGFGGTIHIKQNPPVDDEPAVAQNNPEAEAEMMGSSRTFPKPLPISFRVPGEPEEEEAAPSAVVSAADFQLGPIAPGEIVSIFGRGLGPAVLETLQLDSRGRVPSFLGNLQVLFDGLPAPILHARSDQAAVVVPFGIQGEREVEMIVTRGGSVSAPVVLPVAPSAPGLFSLNATGRGQGAILNSDFSINSASNRAAKNSFVVLFGTGGGTLDQPVVDGALAGANPPRMNQPVRVSIGGADTSVFYAGGAPGLAHGVIQVNVMLNERVPSGEAVPVTLTVGEASSSAAITVAIQ